MKVWWFIIAWLYPFSLQAGDIRISVVDTVGKPVPDAVITLFPGENTPVRNIPSPGSHKAAMIQRGKEFIPYVLPVKTGTPVEFPNQDDILHHVYSFSSAKSFEINLYAGTPVDPILFDQPGVVALGCNIHDWMLGFIYVTDTPYFVKTDKTGSASLATVPAGQYRASIWQPRIKGKLDSYDQKVAVTDNADKSVSFTISLKPEIKKRSSEDQPDSEYTAF